MTSTNHMEQYASKRAMKIIH